ncbi:helix-turn-helix domain-containing protein [Kineococcus arenarius]|uniref:helix-turn-helix domain-containing protein n=1 Tax=Kineococcus sp. SYSU DK007 TaxID=3383128 RepID=UPI003D7DCF7A
MPNISRDRGPTARRVAANVEAIRTARGMGLAELADRVTALGQPMSLGILSKLENGDRRVDVDDLVALALALDVTPSRLLLPAKADHSPLDLTPARVSTAHLAWKWAAGEAPLPPPGTHADLDADEEAFRAENRPHDPGPSWSTVDLAAHVEALAPIGAAIAHAVEDGGVPPAEVEVYLGPVLAVQKIRYAHPGNPQSPKGGRRGER